MNKKIIIGLCILSFLMVGCGCQKKKENKKSVKEVTGIDVNMDVVKDKSSYSMIKIIALNLTSVSGFVQVFMLIAILFDMMDIFTFCYFVCNFLVMLVSLRSIYKGR